MFPVSAIHRKFYESRFWQIEIEKQKKILIELTLSTSCPVARKFLNCGRISTAQTSIPFASIGGCYGQEAKQRRPINHFPRESRALKEHIFEWTFSHAFGRLPYPEVKQRRFRSYCSTFVYACSSAWVCRRLPLPNETSLVACWL